MAKDSFNLRVFDHKFLIKFNLIDEKINLLTPFVTKLFLEMKYLFHFDPVFKTKKPKNERSARM